MDGHGTIPLVVGKQVQQKFDQVKCEEASFAINQWGQIPHFDSSQRILQKEQHNLYTLHPNVTHLIQLLDLVLMNIVKMNYWSEVRHWLKENPGALYNKYVFIQVFKEVCLKSAKVEYMIKGFEELGIYPMNRKVIKKVNLP